MFWGKKSNWVGGKNDIFKWYFVNVNNVYSKHCVYTLSVNISEWKNPTASVLRSVIYMIHSQLFTSTKLTI